MVNSNKYSCLDHLLELPWYLALYFAIKYFGYIYGALTVIVIWQLYTRSVKMFFGLEHLTGMDSFWFHDDERNYANIVAFMRFEKFNPEDFRE